jgi:TolB-like protein/tetratricopeptide (TPR) repeat protein
MSPEQIASAYLDERSDLFQLGAVLYECFSGRPAFPGGTVIERLSAVLTRDPDPLPTDIPRNIAAVVLRALERDANRRYASAAAFLLDLQRAGAGELIAPVEPPAAAVLDFANATADPADNWMGSGIAETLATELGRQTGLRVIARDRVDAAASAVQAGITPERRAVLIGQRTGSRWVLSGQFERLGDGLRIVLKLVDASTERTLVDKAFDGTVPQIFEVQDRIVSTVAGVLALTRDTRVKGAEPPPMSAFELYARGRRLFLRLEKGSMDQARAYYQQAIEVDPGYAPALAGLAGFHAMRFTFTTDRATLDTAADLARRAVAADASSAEARNWLGYALFRSGDLEQAAEEFAHARALQPEWFFPFYFGGAVAHVLRNPHDAIGLAQRAVVLEPRQSFPMLALACFHTDAGHYDDALWCFDRAAAIERSHSGAAQWPGLAGFHAESLRRIGRLDEARTMCLAAIEDVERSDHMYRDSNRVVCLVTLGRIALQQGDRDGARAALQQAMAHLHGRERTLAGGCLATEALAGLARTDIDRRAFDEALALYTKRDRFDFSWLYFCWDDVTLLDLSRAAAVLGLREDAATFRARAAAAGSLEAVTSPD